MKYIDAELLRKEIKRRIEILKKAELDWAKQGDKETSVYYSGKSVALDEFTDFIDSLQQEQPEVDLEKEYKEYVEDDPVFSTLTNRNVGLLIARHFYNLGKLSNKK